MRRMQRTRPSHTATKIARMTIFMAGHPVLGPLMPPQMGATNTRLLEAAGVLKPWHLRAYRAAWFSRMVQLSERFKPGMLNHMALRKRFIDDEVERAVAAGVRQVVVLGAGMDGMAARRAPQHPAVSFLELDHPVTQPAKAAALHGAGLMAPNLSSVPADLLARPLAEILSAQPGWDTTAPTLFVAEGLLMYLTPDAVETLLRGAHAASGPGSRLAFSWIPSDERGQDGLGATLRASMAALGEQVLWKPRLDAVHALLQACGWAPDSAPARVDLHARYFAGTAHAGEVVGGVERVCVAERA